jgi:hypothetical protein
MAGRAEWGLKCVGWGEGQRGKWCIECSCSPRQGIGQQRGAAPPPWQRVESSCGGPYNNLYCASILPAVTSGQPWTTSAPPPSPTFVQAARQVTGSTQSASALPCCNVCVCYMGTIHKPETLTPAVLQPGEHGKGKPPTSQPTRHSSALQVSSQLPPPPPPPPTHPLTRSLPPHVNAHPIFCHMHAGCNSPPALCSHARPGASPQHAAWWPDPTRRLSSLPAGQGPWRRHRSRCCCVGRYQCGI